MSHDLKEGATMRKEKNSAIALGVIFTIIINILVFVGMLITSMVTSIYNPDYWKDCFTEDGVIDEFYKYAEDHFSESLEESVDDSVARQYDFEYDDLFSKDFTKRMIGDMVDGMLTGKKHPFDDDYYEDYLLDEVIPELEDQTGYRFSVAEKEDMVEDFIDSLNDSVKDTEEDLEDNSVIELMDQKDSVKAGAVAIFVIAGVLAFIMFMVYKSKFRALRNICIAVFFAAGADALVMSALHTSFKEYIDDEIQNGSFEKDMRKIYEAFGEIFLKDTEVVPAIICGIALIGWIAFSILRKHESGTDEDDMDEALRYNSSEYYAHTAAPLQAQGYNTPYGQNSYGQTPYGTTSNPYGTTPSDPIYGTPVQNAQPVQPYTQPAQFDPNNYTANQSAPYGNYTTGAAEEKANEGGFFNKLPPEDNGLN